MMKSTLCLRDEEQLMLAIRVILCHQFSPTTIDCVGSWSDCSVTCGTGTQTYTITTAAAIGGSACEAAHESTQGCNMPACPGDEHCDKEHSIVIRNALMEG